MIDYAPVSMTGRGLPSQVEDAFSSVGGSIAMLVDELNWELEQLRNVKIPGQGTVGLQELFDGTAAWAEAMFVPAGTIVMYHGRWQNAAEIPGWAICDGSNGTPEIHPPPSSDSPVQRMVRATAFGTRSGTTAGAKCHCHTTCTTSSCTGGHNHVLGDAQESCGYTSCDCHCHTLNCDCVTTCCDGCHGHEIACDCTTTCIDGCHCHGAGSYYSAQCTASAQACGGTTHCFSCHDHCHDVCGCSDCNTHQHGVCGCTCCGCESCHQHGVCGATCCEPHCHCLCGTTCNTDDHAHTLGCKVTSCDAHLPQLIDVIFLMKL